MKKVAVEKFISNIERLLRGEKFDVQDLLIAEISASFQQIAPEILRDQMDEGMWYDGFTELTIDMVDNSVVEFFGNMNVCLDQEEFWVEPFFSRVSDERSQGKGVLVYIQMGELEGEGDLQNLDTEMLEPV